MPFRPRMIPPEPQVSGDNWFVFQDRKLLVGFRGNRPEIPTQSELRPLLPRIAEPTVLGTVDGAICCAGDLGGGCAIPEGLEFCDLRRIFPTLAEDAAQAAGYGFHLIRWKRTNRFCGRCGAAMADCTQERSRRCVACGTVTYPRVSPAVIVAVSRGDRILLARASRYRARIYSVLAGYVEPGEDLEGCVRREVREEVGLELKNIRYFGSQSWPFSGALMVAFTAEYAAGSLCADGREIVEADWFHPDALPPVPEPISIARRLIDDFVIRVSGRSNSGDRRTPPREDS